MSDKDVEGEAAAAPEVATESAVGAGKDGADDAHGAKGADAVEDAASAEGAGASPEQSAGEGKSRPVASAAVPVSESGGADDGGAEARKDAKAETGPALRSRIALGGKGIHLLRAAVALVVVASVASTFYFFTQNRENRALLDAREEAAAAACRYAPVLANYDAKNLDPYFAAVLDGATGDWKTQFDDTSKELREVLTQGEVVSKVEDVQCAVKTGDETSAEAIVVIGQTITSLGTQGQPAPGQLSMVMRMEKVDGTWLVNNVNSPLAQGPQQ
ncbi:hypothetical protein [Nocardia puris]|uniref:hypothetical protein n=1 Tax=Nocardia puris TaxID=208602 RepID=UPI001E30475B|nr:hypothetical protein [Nocardia puris]